MVLSAHLSDISSAPTIQGLIQHAHSVCAANADANLPALFAHLLTCGPTAGVYACRWYDAPSQTINFITEYFTSGTLRQ